MSAVLESRELALEKQRQAVLSHYDQRQRDAALRLYYLVRRHRGTSGGNAAAKLLLGLYNGPRFPFDLTDFRVFDAENLECAVEVLLMDARHTWCEIHCLLNAILGPGANTGAEFENWAFNLKLKGRCTKENLPPLPAVLPAIPSDFF